jgi:hypothetical protein
MKKLDKATTDKFKDDYISGMSVIDIGKKYLCNQVTVSKYLKKQGVEIKPKPPVTIKYACDVDFFKEIDSEPKAYWLGFFLAEGWLHKQVDTRSAVPRISYRMGVELSTEDVDHLYLLKKAVKSDAPISLRTRPGKTKDINLCCLRIGDTRFCLNLAKYAGVGSKSRTIKMPEISTELKRHLVRGFFDGEGSVYIQKTGRQRAVSITSNSRAFLEEIAALLGFPVKIYPYKHESCYKLSIARQAYLLKLYDYLYMDSSVHLPRKRLKFEELSRIIGKPVIENLGKNLEG